MASNCFFISQNKSWVETCCGVEGLLFRLQSPLVLKWHLPFNPFHAGLFCMLFSVFFLVFICLKQANSFQENTCCCFISNFVVRLYYAILLSSYAMRRCLLDLGCAIVVVNVFVVLLCRDLTTAESRVKVWRWENAFKPHGSLGCCLVLPEKAYLPLFSPSSRPSDCTSSSNAPSQILPSPWEL